MTTQNKLVKEMTEANTKRRGRPVQGGSNLSAEKVLSQAKTLLADQGKIPSVRALATSLGVDAMAIYNYYQNKNALLEAIAVSLIDDIYQPAATAQWQAELQQLALSYLQLLRQYPGLLTTLLGMTSTSPAQVFAQRFNQALRDLPLTAETKQQALFLLVDYLHGFALACECSTDLPQQPQNNDIKGPLQLMIRGLESHL